MLYISSIFLSYILIFMFEVFCELCTPSFPLNIPIDILSEDVLNFCVIYHILYYAEM